MKIELLMPYYETREGGEPDGDIISHFPQCDLQEFVKILSQEQLLVKINESTGIVIDGKEIDNKERFNSIKKQWQDLLKQKKTNDKREIFDEMCAIVENKSQSKKNMEEQKQEDKPQQQNNDDKNQEKEKNTSTISFRSFKNKNSPGYDENDAISLLFRDLQEFLQYNSAYQPVLDEMNLLEDLNINNKKIKGNTFKIIKQLWKELLEQRYNAPYNAQDLFYEMKEIIENVLLNKQRFSIFNQKNFGQTAVIIKDYFDKDGKKDLRFGKEKI